MKKLINFILIISILFSTFIIPTTAQAEENYSVVLNGQKLEFDQPPIMKNDRILVPFRVILEAMNADVYYDSEKDNRYNWIDYDWCAITAVKNTSVIQMYNINNNWTLKKTTLYNPNDFHDVEIDVNPIILNGRTLVPIRALTECFGAQVSWDSDTKTVIIIADTSGSRKSEEEIKTFDNFSWVKAAKIIESLYLASDGDVYAPPRFDTKGKFFAFPSYDADDNYIGVLNVYYDGSIIDENGQSIQRTPTNNNDKILNGNLSDFAGVWTNADNRTINLQSDGTEGLTYVKPSDGKTYSQIAEHFTKNENGVYQWSVRFDFTDEENGSYDIWLYPVGVEVEVNGTVVDTDTSKVRLYAGQDFYSASEMKRQIFYKNNPNSLYTPYTGKWNWDNSEPLLNNKENWYTYDEAWVDIQPNDDSTVTLQYYHQKGGVHLYEYEKCIGFIQGNTITAKTKARKGEMFFDDFTLTLTFYDDMMWLEAYNDTQGGLAFSGTFYK